MRTWWTFYHIISCRYILTITLLCITHTVFNFCFSASFSPSMSLSFISLPFYLQSLFASIEEMFKNHLKTQLQRLGITNNGSTQHG